MPIKYTHTNVSNQPKPTFSVDSTDDSNCIVNVKGLGKVVISITEDDLGAAIYSMDVKGGEPPVAEVSCPIKTLKDTGDE